MNIFILQADVIESWKLNSCEGPEALELTGEATPAKGVIPSLIEYL